MSALDCSLADIWFVLVVSGRAVAKLAVLSGIPLVVYLDCVIWRLPVICRPFMSTIPTVL